MPARMKLAIVCCIFAISATLLGIFFVPLLFVTVRGLFPDKRAAAVKKTAEVTGDGHVAAQPAE